MQGREITRVANAKRWFTYSPRNAILDFCLGHSSSCSWGEPDASLLKFVRELSELKIGEISTRWDDSCQSENRLPIDLQHAKIRVGDVFDYYTTSEGVLEIPKWKSSHFAGMEYPENDPRIKFHPDRVREFVEQHGVDHLEEMHQTK
ncbi:hypothetical protein PHYSODRAFT_331688 [Phytophthora sojae]|uniref:Uncharacterized protein n=1 Tax=Phytophthora sojae (strain P6497) TaxID=1094619 RepID=G4ZJ90_PHYSP|nr:hypothetical protein PHYSODRAFT_331688 [Phytophthora sojae]EGZ17754.1 hypothetical protein PHYSODRAFT_331688 [Phytophthora sojae]|eukprot:XP_009526812.1 hypothetical protein PHYSODRAFT_331688 [Phytophthora sojae]